MNNEDSICNQKMVNLWNIVEKFIKEQKITCPETIYSCDNVITNSYSFIRNCCNVVGYLKTEEDE
jgi:hypothetical protein